MYWNEETRNKAEFSKLKVSSGPSDTGGWVYLKCQSSARRPVFPVPPLLPYSPWLPPYPYKYESLNGTTDERLPNDTRQDFLRYKAGGRPFGMDLGVRKGATH